MKLQEGLLPYSSLRISLRKSPYLHAANSCGGPRTEVKLCLAFNQTIQIPARQNKTKIFHLHGQQLTIMKNNGKKRWPAPYPSSRCNENHHVCMLRAQSLTYWTNNTKFLLSNRTNIVFMCRCTLDCLQNSAHMLTCCLTGNSSAV